MSDDAASLSTLLRALGAGIDTGTWGQLLINALGEGQIDETTAEELRQLYSRLEGAARREGLLRLLNETATDLIGIRDVESILKAIVRRTRALIGSDIAYLSLNDYDRGESFIRVTDGATTSQFRGIRIPLGGGVLGAVATGNSPSQSPDYPNDTTKTHFPDSDAAVIAEGVKAIMGVPLWSDGRVIGALMVADRRAHDFSSDDISLMESIGAHAAVALDNARHFTDMAEALSRLETARQENAQHVQALEDISQLDQRLMETLAAKDILPGLQRVLANALDAQVWVLDPAGLAVNDEQDIPADATGSIAREAAAQSVSLRAPASFTADTAYTVMAAVAGDQHLASILVCGDVPDHTPTLLERGALVLSAAMLFERTLRDAQYRLQRELIDELLGSRFEITEPVRARAKRFGIAEDTAVTVHIVNVRVDQRQRALTVLRAHSSGSGIVAIHDGEICVIHPVDALDADPLGTSYLEILRGERITATVGSSRVAAGLHAYPGAHAEAARVLAALLALGRKGDAANRASLGTAGMLIGSMNEAFTVQFLDAQLGPLLRYDARKSTDLVSSAWTYLEHDSSYKAAAELLHIHPNTMRKRLDRIDEVLGDTWRKGGRLLDVHIALRVWRLRTEGFAASLS